MFTMSLRKILFYIVVIGFSFCGPVFLQAAEDEISTDDMFVEDLLLMEDQWPYWAKQGEDITVEGRFKTMTRLNMTLQQSDLPFKPATGIEFNREHKDSNIVRLRGALTYDESENLFFRVSRFEHLRSLEEEDRQQNLQPGSSASEAFYNLARRFQNYGRFYEENDLLARAEELYTGGLQTERKQLRNDNYKGLFGLADRAGQLTRGRRYEFELRHEAFRKWGAEVLSGELNEAKFEEFLDTLLSQLPGASAPLPEVPAERKQQYETAPLDVYRQADGFARLELHRLFYADMVERFLLSQLAKDGSNGMDLAERLETLVPESTLVTKSIRQAGLEFKLKRVEQLTRSDMLSARRYFLEYEELEKAKEVVRRWLENRELRATEEGPAAVPQLARDRTEFLGDQKGAIELLLRTIRTYPDVESVKKELGEQGYAFLEGRWQNLAEWEAAQPDNSSENAMRQGFVVEGMTFEQVELTLGYPVTRLRSVSAQKVLEIWTFPQSQTSKILVTFDWTRGASRVSARVVKVEQQ
ncbi:hypothetical protein Pla110_04640 [Polystyrenella longa]|uniref:Uncharacterized protein n=1 Tax=Polystyrenella longa TaxID=2528007 RepID=A0A518CHQ5_9PLAN|nr:hypothetical protein [Polystyrenella longa]QDU78760.1 hypothetical protein Pla110_04640 [Polystyrenella longa]